MIDLHMHTTFSDGTSSPEALIESAVAQGLKAIAITDHDTMLSYPAALAAAEGTELEIIPGIEINTVWKKQDVHVLGYYINPEHEALRAVMDKHRAARVTQIEGIAERLHTKAKLKITYADIAAYASTEGSIGRPHIARAIVDRGGASSIGAAFQKFLHPESVTYLRRETVTPHEAVEAIYESGGIPVIAHPGEMEIIEELVIDLMNYGLRGLEAYHRSHSPAVIEFHCTLAEKYGLIVTGGTDFHGAADTYAQAYSRLKMPAYVYDELKNERRRLELAAFKAS